MPIDKKTSAQFVTQWRNSILTRTRKYDTGYGPLLDAVARPISDVLEDQNNNRLRVVSLLLSRENSTEFSEEDLDAQAFNEDVVRPEGSQATTTLRFRRNTPFDTADSGIVQRGFPIGTTASEETGQPVTFVTTEARDKTSAVAVIDEDTNQTVYDVNIPAIALIRGEAGKVGPNRVNRPLRPLVGYNSVTNEAAAQEGRDRYTNAELIELLLLAVGSRQLSVAFGSEFHVRDTFDSVIDINEVFGTDPLLIRGGEDAGAVDSFVLGDDLIAQTDQIAFLGVGQTMECSIPPVVNVTSVVRLSDSTSYVEDTDYEVNLDSTGVSGSIRAHDGVRFLPTADPMPTIGDLIAVTYEYNQLIRDLQADAEDDEVEVEGRDLLFRLATEVPIFLTASLRASSGFSYGAMADLVVEAILTFGGDLRLGDDVEISDLQRAVRALTGVDNFRITRLVRDSTETGADDVSIDGNEYGTFDEDNIVLVQF